MSDLPVNYVDQLEGVGESGAMVSQVEVLSATEEVLATITTLAEGSVTFDSTAASRGHVDLSIESTGEDGLVPTSMSSLLAPSGREVRVARGIVRYDRIDMVRLGIYGIGRSEVKDEGASLPIRVSGLDRSWRFIDTPFEVPYEIASGTLNHVAIEAVLREAWPQVPLDLMETTSRLPRLNAEEGENRWAFAQGMALAIGGELYFNDLGVCVLRPASPVIGPPVATFAEGEGGVLVGIEREWDRGSLYNRVIVTAETTDSAGPLARAVATDDNPNSPTYYYGSFGKKPYFYANEFIGGEEVSLADAQVQCDAVAQSLLARFTGAPDSMTFETVTDPGRRPGDIIRAVRQRLGVNEDHVIDGITIPLTPEGVTTCQTRVAQELVA